MYPDAELIPISALQHLLFCERQAALIHVERLWAENRLTVEGRQQHRRTHDPRKVSGDHRHGRRTVRGMELVSHRLGLVGVADVVEFPPEYGHVADSGPSGSGSGGGSSGGPMPVEHKRGRPKKHDADKVQLCAQAICLEEMLDPDRSPGWITHGQLFYGQTRRRLDVTLDEPLRKRTLAAVARMREIITAGLTPPARREKKCDRCSLLHLCLPDALRPRKTASAYLHDIARQLLDPLSPIPAGGP